MQRGVIEMRHETRGCRSALSQRSAQNCRLSLVICRLSQRPRTNDQPRGLRSRGFTLLELMIVLSIIMILMAVAVPMYNQSIIQARESVSALKSEHATVRDFSVHARQTKGASIARRPGHCRLPAANSG